MTEKWESGGFSPGPVAHSVQMFGEDGKKTASAASKKIVGPPSGCTSIFRLLQWRGPMKGILFDIPSPSFLGEDHPPGSDAYAPNPHLVGIFIPDPIWWGGCIPSIPNGGSATEQAPDKYWLYTQILVPCIRGQVFLCPL